MIQNITPIFEPVKNIALRRSQKEKEAKKYGRRMIAPRGVVTRTTHNTHVVYNADQSRKESLTITIHINA